MSQRQESDDADHSGDSSARSGQGAQPRSQPQFQTQLQPHPQFQSHCSQPSAGDCSGGDESTRGGDNGPHQSANQQATTSATAAEDRPARAPALDSIAASDSPSVLGDDDPRNGRTPAVADVAAVSPFSRLATVELQLIMRCCDQFTLLALARCSRFTLAAASHPFVWQPLSPIALRCDWPLELSGRLRAEKSLLRHADISVTWRPWPKAAMSAEQVNSLAALPRLRGLTVESSYDFATDRHTQLSDEGAALLFQSLSERIDHGGALASLSFIGIKIGQAGVASLATFIVRSRSLASLKIIYASNALLASLSASMAQCRTLTSLELHSQSTGSSIVTDRALMSFLQNTSLATLKLRDLRLGDTAVVVLAAAVAQSRSLTDLQLRKTHIGNAGIEALAAALEQSGRICTLDLSRDSLDTAAAAALARLLASDCCALTSLNLSGSQIGHEGVLAEALQTNRSLTELRLCANEMGGQGTAAVAAALRRNPHCRLLVLGLSENRIDLPTAAALAEAMRRSGAFERLEVSECSLTDEGLATLAAGISHSHSLQHLDLVRNSFGAAGAAALASAVATCPALTWLDVRHNKIGDEGLAALAPALQLVPVRLRTLMLSSCGLTQSSAGPLAELIQSSRVLEYLDIDGNSLETQGVAEIAAALQPSSSLRVLRVRTVCGIGARGTAAVAAALSRGWKASKLRLQCGGPTDSLGALALAAAMEELGSRCTLTSLSLSGRGMTAAGTLALVRAVLLFEALRERIRHGGALTSLSVVGDQFDQASSAGLAAFIERSRSLASLSVACASSNFPITALAAALVQCRTLTSLKFGCNEIQPDAFRAMATVVRHSPSLTTLILFRLRCDAESVAVFAAAVAQNRSLTDLQLPDCGIDDADMEALSAAIEQNSSTVRRLDVSGNQLGCAGAAALARLLTSERCALTSLDVSQGEIGDNGALVLSEALRTNRSLTELRLGPNPIGSEGTAALLVALQQNQNCRLRVLALSGSSITQSAAAALAEAMRRSGAFERLEVSGCSLLDEGLATLAAGMSHSHSLQYLDVSCNPLGAAGAAALAAVISACPSLTSLDVGGNEIGDAGVSTLAPSLIHLRRLKLNGCGLTPSSARPLAELIQHSRVLESLDLSDNELGARGVSEIAAALQPSSSLRTLYLQEETKSPGDADGTVALASAVGRGWRVSELWLDFSRRDDGGVHALASALKQRGDRCTLTTLSLSSSGVTTAGALALVRAVTHAPRLRKLDLCRNSGITAAGKQALIAACGPQPHFELSLSA